jgi:hypothetical protein
MYKNLNKVLSKEQKKLLFDIIRKKLMDGISEFKPSPYGKGIYMRESDQATKQLGNDRHYYMISYTDKCMRVSISFIHVLLPTYEGSHLWFGKDKDFKDCVRCGWYSTFISFTDETSTSKNYKLDSFHGRLNSLPRDIYQYLKNQAQSIEPPKPEPEPNYSSILVKADSCE